MSCGHSRKNLVSRRDDSPTLRDEGYATFWEMGGPRNGLVKMSAAFFVIDAGATSPRHFHRYTEEQYLVVDGRGVMHLGEDAIAIGPGDCVSIPLGIVHAITNPGPEPLALWVLTSPPYDVDDDIVVDQ